MSEPLKNPQNNELYKLLFNDKEVLHHNFVGVVHKNNKWEVSYYNIGMKPDDLNYDDLQSLIDHYYNQQKENWPYIDFL